MTSPIGCALERLITEPLHRALEFAAELFREEVKTHSRFAPLGRLNLHRVDMRGITIVLPHHWDEGQPNFAALLEWNSAPVYAQNHRRIRRPAGGAVGFLGDDQTRLNIERLRS